VWISIWPILYDTLADSGIIIILLIKVVELYKLGFLMKIADKTGNALARVQRVHEPADLWDITFCTR
jgi:hypothetical protein